MGRGDKRSRKGKINRSSYGKARPHKPARVKKRKAAKRPPPRPRR
jgi:ribosomal small subunit protein bTHX